MLATSCVDRCSKSLSCWLQQRAREVVEWRSHRAEQQKLQEEQSAIQLKQQRHLEEYQREREPLAHLSWRQRRAALYRADKIRFSVRPSERTESDELGLSLVIKGGDGAPPGSARRDAADR